LEIMGKLLRARAVEFCAFLFLLAATALSAQSLLGTWVSTEPILVNLKFSLTFHDDDYEVDCSLGQTIGTYTVTKDKIFFTPTKIGINSGDIGKNDIWDYSFVDNESFYLSSGPIKLRLFRRPA
jgi:hypothetical protein